jgi:hypothetical protein
MQGQQDEGFFKEVKQSIYRLGQTDTWGCRNCKIKDDKWGMQKYPCSGLLKTLAKPSGLQSNQHNLSRTAKFSAIGGRS